MKLLIVDDNETNLKIFSMILSLDGYEIKTLSSAEEISSKLNSDVDLILLSNKFEKECENLSEKKVVVMTTNPSVDEVVRFYSEGIKDYIILPASADVIRKKVDEALNKEKALEDILSSFRHVQVKDNGSYKHLERMKAYARTLATELKENNKHLKIDEEFIKNLELASILHDIGKIFEYTINTESGLIDYDENFRKEWLTHSQYGFSICMNAGFKRVAKMIAAHHARTDWGAIVDLNEKDLEPIVYLVHHIDDLSAKFGQISVSMLG